MVLFRNKWQQVCPLDLTQHFQNLLCKTLPGECGEAMENPNPEQERWNEVNSCFLLALCMQPYWKEIRPLPYL